MSAAAATMKNLEEYDDDEVDVTVPVQIIGNIPPHPSSVYDGIGNYNHPTVGNGFISLVAHGLQLCAQSARCSVQDLQMAPGGWKKSIPVVRTNTSSSLQDDDNDSVVWIYVQHALIYHRQHVPTSSKVAEADHVAWLQHWNANKTNDANHQSSFNVLPPHLLGRIAFYYVSSKELSPEELSNPTIMTSEDDDDLEDDDDEDEEEDDDEDDDCNDMNVHNKKEKKDKALSQSITSSSFVFAPEPPPFFSNLWKSNQKKVEDYKNNQPVKNNETHKDSNEEDDNEEDDDDIIMRMVASQQHYSQSSTCLDDTKDTNHTSICLYHAAMEYRSLPATGNPFAVQAETWSMMTWDHHHHASTSTTRATTSLDDELKHAALAGLSCQPYKYLLEIESVRGKRYQFDWIPAITPSSTTTNQHSQQASWKKCLGVHVSNRQPHHQHLSEASSWALTRMQFRLDPPPKEMMISLPLPPRSTTSSLYDLPRVLQKHFVSLRSQTPTQQFRATPSGHTLLLSSTTRTTTTKATMSEVGQIYWQGRMWKNWNRMMDSHHRQQQHGIDQDNDGDDDDVWNHVRLLFGMNLNLPFPYHTTTAAAAATTTNNHQFFRGNPFSAATVATDSTTRRRSYLPPSSTTSMSSAATTTQRRVSHTNITDYPSLQMITTTATSSAPVAAVPPMTMLKKAYAVLWQELLIDARYGPWNLAGKLLHRLIYDQDMNDDNDDGEEETVGHVDDQAVWPQRPPPSAYEDCLESLVLQSPSFDPVGIAAKALSTQFGKSFGLNAFPCLHYEVDWVLQQLPQRRPIVIVPPRALNLLRRGGYMDVTKTVQDVLQEEILSLPQAAAAEVSSAVSLTPWQEKVVRLACLWLSHALVEEEERITGDHRHPQVALVPNQSEICRYDTSMQVLQVRDDFFTLDWSVRLGKPHFGRVDLSAEEHYVDKHYDGNNNNDNHCGRSIATMAYLLGMYMAQAHSNHDSRSDVLARYVLQHARLPSIPDITATTN